VLVGEANIDSSQGPQAFMVDAHNCSRSVPTWYVDSGVSQHMSNQCLWFFNFTPVPHGVGAIQTNFFGHTK